MALDQSDKDDIVNAISAGFTKASQSTSTTAPAGGTSGDTSKSSQNSLNKASSGFMRILDEGGGSIKSFAKDFNSMMPEVLQGLGGAVGGIAGHIEDTQGVFQNLSKVGIGLNGNLGDLRVQAAKSRMPLDQFANMVATNAQSLVGLAGNASEGAKRFADLSNAMYSTGAIEGFMNLGYSIEEANEFVIKNTELNRRQAMMTQMSDAEQVKQAQELAKNMSIVAKLTGKDAQQMQDELIARQRAGATQARLRLLEMDGVTGAQEAYNKAQTALDAAPDVVGNLFDDLMQTGAPMTEATKNFAATNQEAYALLQQAAEANKRGDVAEAERLAQEAAQATADFAQSRQGLTLATLSQVSDIAKGQADVLEEMAPIIDGTMALQQRIKDATGQELTFREAFVANLQTIAAGQETQMAGEQPGQQALTAVNTAQVALANTASEFNTLLGKQIESNTLLLSAYGTLNEKISTQLGVETQNFLAMLNEMIPGSTLSETIPNIELFADQLKAAGVISEETVANLKILADSASSAGQKQSAQAALVTEGVLDSTGQISKALADALLNTRRENMSEQDTTSGSSGDWFSRALDSIKGLFGFEGGTPGAGSLFKDFGEGTFQPLHGLESVTKPEQMAAIVANSAKGALQAAESAMGGGKFSPSALENLLTDVNSVSQPPVSRMGETSENSLDNLNQTLLQLVELNRNGLEIASKQLRATKGLDGNVMSSVGI